YLFDKKIALIQLSPGSQVRQNMQWLDNISLRLENLISTYFIQRQQELALVEEKITAFDPFKILSRGYALVEDKDGYPIISVEQVQLGEGIQVNISDGIISADVNKIEKRIDDR
ncbi:MAG: hypothetical protein J7L66_01715, partial [Anaerolineaceae bacterium]|nr:hypothetical protein [Anaerolineaceae bacterium]